MADNQTWQPGDKAAAINAGGEWWLAPLCPEQNPQSGLAVKGGGQWWLLPRTPRGNSDNYGPTVKVGGESLLLPSRCASSGGGDDNSTPAADCAYLLESDNIAMQYLVNVSGMGEICYFDWFNGIHLVTLTSSCRWEFHINEYMTVALQVQAGPIWRVTCAGHTDGAQALYFFGQGGYHGAPETQEFLPNGNADVEGCEGMAAMADEDVIVTVSRVE